MIVLGFLVVRFVGLSVGWVCCRIVLAGYWLCCGLVV